MVEYEQGDGPEFSRATWLDVKPTLGLAFPNLPYLIDGDHSMTETAAIHKYLADKYKPELLGSNPQERGHVQMISAIVFELKFKTTGPCYGSGNKDEINAIVTEKMPAILAFRGNRKFLFDTPCWVDFQFYELI